MTEKLDDQIQKLTKKLFELKSERDKVREEELYIF